MSTQEQNDATRAQIRDTADAEAKRATRARYDRAIWRDHA